MNKGNNFFILSMFLVATISCKKDDVRENCYVCSNDIESINVCEENRNFIIEGEVVENENGASLEDLIRAIEENEDNDPDLEGISCTRS